MRHFRWIWVVLLLTACHPADTLPPTATTLHVVQATLPDTAGRDLHPVASQTPEVAATECSAPDGLPTTRHTASATISYTHHSAEVEQQIETINRGSQPMTDAVLDVEANRLSGRDYPNSVNADHNALSYDLTGRRLSIDLGDPVEPGCTLVITLSFTLQVPAIGGNDGYFGYSSHQLNLGQWLPMLAWRHDDDWIIHDFSAIGEQVVVDVADWDVTLTVSDAPPNLMIAAPGTLTEHQDNRWHYTLANAREFTLSLSPDYQIVTEKTANNVSVELYTFADRTVQTAQGTVDNTQQALHAASQGLALDALLFGSYPYQRFVVVQGDFPDGMEFSGIVFVSDQWFRTNTGSAESYLTIITVHETSHQWWYARVGSDQALTPWMDEALAVYSEEIFFEQHYPELKSVVVEFPGRFCMWARTTAARRWTAACMISTPRATTSMPCTCAARVCWTTCEPISAPMPSSTGCAATPKLGRIGWSRRTSSGRC